MNSSAIALPSPFRAGAESPRREAPRRNATAESFEAVLPTQPGGGSHAFGLGAVVLVHLVVGYALVSGLAQKVVDSVRAPIEARLIEAAEPPPPPEQKPIEKVVEKPVVKAVTPTPPPFVPPPEVQVAAQPPAPTIAAVTHQPPPAPLEFKPEPPPVTAAVAPPVAAPQPVAIGVACHSMVNPVMPRRAEQEGIGGAVKARATIRGGKVVDVQILSSSPRGLFDAAVKAAMAQYGCDTGGAQEIVAVQNFEFRAAQ